MRTLTELTIADPPDRWEALGFALDGDACQVGDVTLRLGDAGSGVTSWSIAGLEPEVSAIDGLPTRPAPASTLTAADHPNGAVAIDHVVILSPDFDRTMAALEAFDMPLRRIRELDGFRQGFRRIGPAILELVEARGEDAAGPARFWGLVVVVSDLDVLASRLGQRLGPVKPAVQPGRQIATLRASAGLSPAVAFMDPERLGPFAK